MQCVVQCLITMIKAVLVVSKSCMRYLVFMVVLHFLLCLSFLIFLTFSLACLPLLPLRVIGLLGRFILNSSFSPIDYHQAI